MSEPVADVIVVVEDDARLDRAISTVKALRNKGWSAEMVASGSPRKRFDKAKKIPSHALVTFPVTDENVSTRIMGDGGNVATAVESFLLRES